MDNMNSNLKKLEEAFGIPLDESDEIKLPICTKVKFDLSVDKNINIDELRLLKAGTKVFSTKLQENLSFSDDIVVKVTNAICGVKDYCYGNIQIYSFLGDNFYNKANGDIGFNFSETTKYNHKPRT